MQLYKKSAGFSEVLVTIIGVGAIVVAMVYQDVRGFLYYPVLVNITLLLTFVLSLFYGQPIITRMAQLTTELDDDGLHYTRQLTVVWAVFFVINGIAALITTQLSLHIWTVYNGVISYIMIGLLAGSEWLYRKRKLG
ncbi:hypothetical protein [Vibrio sp. MA40-2]|uniref:COG4648 family protein n=1 Tax=Vibrio sp. MA40-2 TaxID=3391828 RepID=UPI0039A403AB